jgi:[ribosomal protein S5]-alanine N-acetyltransferase
MRTENLELLPHGPQHLRAMIEGPRAYAESFGFASAEALTEFFAGGELSPAWLAELEAATEADPWKHGFALLHPASGTVVGVASFKGPPDEAGVVEIAYGIAPGYRGRGFATEAARALTRYALESGEVRVVLAHTLPEPNASTRVLAKCGFRYVDEVIDPEDGPVWRWQAESAAG